MLKPQTVRLSILMKWCVALLALCLVGLIGYMALDHGWVGDIAREDYESLEIASLPENGRFWALWAIVSVPILCWALTLFNMYRLFDGFSRRQVFTEHTTASVRAIGGWMLCAAGAQFVTRIAGSIVMTAANPPGERAVHVMINSQDMMVAAFGVMMLIMGVVMHEAVRLSRENEQIV